MAPPLRGRVSSPNQNGRRGPPHWICRQKGARSLVDTKPTRSLLWKRQGPGKKRKRRCVKCMVLWKLRCRSTSPGTQLIARTPNPLCIIHDGEKHAWNHWCAHTELNTINFKDDKILFVCSYTQHKNINLSFIYHHYFFFL